MDIEKIYKNKLISSLVIIILFLNSIISLKEIYLLHSLSYKTIISTQFSIHEDKSHQNYEHIEEEICSNDIRLERNDYIVWKISHNYHLLPIITPFLIGISTFKTYINLQEEKYKFLHQTVILNLFKNNKSIRAPPIV